MIQETQEFTEVVEEAHYKGIWALNSCSVVALAITANITYEVSLALMTKFGWTEDTGASVLGSVEALEDAGARLEFLGREQIAYLARRFSPRAAYLSVNDFLKVYNKGIFQVVTNGHIFAVIDGVAHDFEHSGRHKVQCAIKIF